MSVKETSLCNVEESATMAVPLKLTLHVNSAVFLSVAKCAAIELVLLNGMLRI